MPRLYRNSRKENSLAQDKPLESFRELEAYLCANLAAPALQVLIGIVMIHLARMSPKRIHRNLQCSQSRQRTGRRSAGP